MRDRRSMLNRCRPTQFMFPSMILGLYTGIQCQCFPVGRRGPDFTLTVRELVLDWDSALGHSPALAGVCTIGEPTGIMAGLRTTTIRSFRTLEISLTATM